MDIRSTEIKIEERLPWHSPEVLRLIVNLDTAEGVGSQTDCVNHDAFNHDPACSGPV